MNNFTSTSTLLLISLFLTIQSIGQVRIDQQYLDHRTDQDRLTRNYYRQNSSMLERRSQTALPEDWEQAVNEIENPFAVFHGFSHVSDSLIWSVGFDVSQLIGVPAPVSKSVSRSVDGGMNWEEVNIQLTDSSLRLTKDSMLAPVFIQAVNEEVIWVALDEVPTQSFGAMVKSEDGGENWERVTLPVVDSQEVPLCLHFFLIQIPEWYL